MLSNSAFVLVVLLGVIMLTACSGTPTSGKLQQVDGGIKIEVPALWADPNTGNSGIEPATVWVDTNRTGDDQAYEVNLTDLEAKGGGAQWQAATSSAAAFATMLSGQNPSRVAYKFEITGPIDGPSAGGILTVGALAALNQQDLKSHVTMTGTISPDGSIGPVGLIGAKLKAAAAAGYTTVVLPAIVTEIVDPDTQTKTDTEEYARNLGITVEFVRSVAEAYSAFTGSSIFSTTPTTRFQFDNFPELNTARQATTESLQADVSERLSQLSGAPSLVSEQLSNSVAAAESGDQATAFALAVDALQVFETWRGQSEFQLIQSEIGIDSAREQLRQQVLTKLSMVNQQINEAVSDSELADPARSLAIPGALAWLTYGQAILSSLATALQDPTLNSQPLLLEEYAGLASEVVAESELVFPLTVEILLTVPESPQAPSQPSQVFQSGYNNFLIEAGNANLNYLRTVLDIPQTNSRVTDLTPVVIWLSAQGEAINPQAESVAQEMKDSAIAMSYFVTTMSLVTALQVVGGADLWLDREERSIGSLEYLNVAVDESLTLTRLKADELLAADMNAGYPLWSAEWGAAAYGELAAKDRTAAGASLALNELWFDAVTVMMMSAYVSDQNS